MTAEPKDATWIAMRADGGMTYSGTEMAMRTKITRELKDRPLHPWLLGKAVSRFAAKILPPEETVL